MDKAVAKAFQVLEAVATSQRPRGVTELATELGMTKANVHRLMRTLYELGYVRQAAESTRYEASLKLWSLGAQVVSRADLLTSAAPVLRALRDNVHESVQLAVPDGDCIVYVDKADSDQPVRATTTIGSRVPMHCVSTGKAILAAAPGIVDTLAFPLEKSTPRTVQRKDELLAQLDAIRAAGYAVNQGEWREGIWGIAAAIVDADARPVAAVGVWGPQGRFEGGNVTRFGAAVTAAAAEISQQLGARIAAPAIATTESRKESST